MPCRMMIPGKVFILKNVQKCLYLCSESEEEDTNLPQWARKEFLRPAIHKQFGQGTNIDPTPSIFPEFAATCNLETIFGSREGVYRTKRRRSSGAWENRNVSSKENEVYIQEMGRKAT